jgi:S-adenosylmethionine hydrolase
MPEPILTLTTDFGLTDHYAAAMKGVILGICPRARIVDISHQQSAFDVLECAYTIAQAYACFPRKTVHVVVVDPGVGSARRPILMRAAGQYFVAPDNGVLSMIYAREKHRIRLISQERYFRRPVSPTFHGRDIFAPVAAHLAAGVAPARMGPPIHDYLKAFPLSERTGKSAWTGRILKIDRFGNVITSFHADEFPGLERRDFSLLAGGHEIEAMARTYASAPPGELVAIVGSGGYLEISVNRGSAAQRIACQAGAAVELKLR